MARLLIKGKVTEGKVIEDKEQIIGEGPIFEFDGYAEIREIMAIPQTIQAHRLQVYYCAYAAALYHWRPPPGFPI